MAERVLDALAGSDSMERAEFTPLFGTLLDRVYLSQIGAIRGIASGTPPR